ncbi:MAG TPA: flagellar hook-length control protein FliK [Thermodesulfobacteriaceae bacterium]|nr:flagellar hook-length control protein FliK [Thermodesulfobacteriaceae bacterium]
MICLRTHWILATGSGIKMSKGLDRDSTKAGLHRVRPGMELEGQVIKKEGASGLISTGNRLLRVTSRIPLPEGSHVRLKVTRPGNPIHVKLLSAASAPPDRGRSMQMAFLRLKASTLHFKNTVMTILTDHSPPDSDTGLPGSSVSGFVRFLKHFSIGAGAEHEKVSGAAMLFRSDETSDEPPAVKFLRSTVNIVSAESGGGNAPYSMKPALKSAVSCLSGISGAICKSNGGEPAKALDRTVLPGAESSAPSDAARDIPERSVRIPDSSNPLLSAKNQCLPENNDVQTVSDKTIPSRSVRTMADHTIENIMREICEIFASHSGSLNNYGQQLQQNLSLAFFMFPLWFDHSAGFGHWAWWSELPRHDRNSDNDRCSHLVFDLELSLLGPVKIHLTWTGKKLKVLIAAERQVISTLTARARELRLSLHENGFRFDSLEIFPLEEADTVDFMGHADPLRRSSSWDAGYFHTVI